VAVRVLASLAPTFPGLADLVAGSSVAAFAPRPAVGGIAGIVPGGAVAQVVVALDGDELVAVTSEPPADPPRNFASAPLADRALRVPGRVVLARGSQALSAHAAATDEWRILVAASLVGLASGALELATAYVKERTQFDRPIGSFQAIQHGLGEIPGRIDGARLLAHEAAWCAQTGQLTATGARGPEMAVMAFVFAGEVARLASSACVQYHGGYGVAEEYDAQLYYRRARGWPLVLGDPTQELHRLARSLFGPPEKVA
jgi:alkylation response protein AidB-like acyl-CoA dehydrogenase